VHEAPGPSVSGPTGHSAPWPKSAASGPVMRNVEIVSGASPVFVTVTAWASDRVPTGSSPKLNTVGLTCACGPDETAAADPNGTSKPTATAAQKAIRALARAQL